MTLLQGLVESVETEPARSFAEADAAVSDMVVFVADASVFQTGSGSCTVDIAGVEYEATPTVDEAGDADFLTLDPALSVAVLDGDIISVVPDAEVKWAYVSVTDEVAQDLNKCRVPLALKGYSALAVGPYSGDERPSVWFETEPDPHLVDPPNQPTLLDAGVLDPDTTVPPAALTDGEPPASSPTPVLEQFAVGALRWSVTAVANADPVRFKVYADTVDPPTVDADHLVADSASTSGTFASIDGTRLLPDDPEATIPTYYVACIEYDADGDAAVSATSNGVQPRRAAVAEISADWVYAGSIEANQIASGSVLTGLLNIGSFIEANGADSTITIYADEAHTTPLVQLRPDGSVFRGQVIADDVSVLNGLVLQGLLSHLAQNAGLTLDSSTKDPAAGPTLTATPASSTWPAVPSGYTPRGFSWDGTQWLRLIWKASTSAGKVEQINTSGIVTGTTTLTNLSAADDVNSVVKVGSNWFGVVDQGGAWEVWKWSTAGAFVSGNLTSSGGARYTRRPALGTDGTNVLVVSSDGSGTIKVETFDTSLVAGATWTASTAHTNKSFAFVGKDNFDFGASRVVVAGSHGFFVFTLSGTTLTEDTTKTVALADDTLYGGFAWNGTNFYAADSGSPLHKYTSYYPATSEKAWVTYADTDSGTTKHTKDSPQSSVTVLARQYIQASLPPAPDGAATPRVYMGLATSSPADTALLLRGETITDRNVLIDPAVAGGTALVRTKTVTNRALTSNVATLTIGTHGFEVGDTITVASVPTDTFFNGTFTITAVTSTTVSYALTHANVSSTSSTGSVTNTDTNTFGAGTPAWVKSQTGGLELYGDGVLRAPKLKVYSTKAYRTAAFNIGTGADANVNMDTFTGSGTSGTTAYYQWDSTNRRWSILADGVYTFAAELRLAGNATGRRDAFIDGNNISRAWTRLHTVDANGVRINVVLGAVPLVAGDYVSLSCFQNSGGNLDAVDSWISITRLGEIA